MRRREFIAGVAGSTAAWPLVARAQPPAMPVIGFLGSASADAFAPLVRGFRKGLSEAGYIEGQNVRIEYRWADDQYDRLPALASDLVQRHVAVLLAGGPPAALAAKAITTTVPVIFIVGFDPIGAQLVSSLSRPGGNLTGMYLYIGGLVAKKLELLHEMAPNARASALLVNPASPSGRLDAIELEAAGRRRGLRVQVLEVRTPAEIAAVLAGLSQRGIGAVLIGTDPFFFSQREQLAELAARHRMAVIAYAREFVAAGGLMSYGVDIPEIYRQGGLYVARVLKGAKPADLAVQQPTKFELVINLKTAKALGLAVSPSLLARADEVIE